MCLGKDNHPFLSMSMTQGDRPTHGLYLTPRDMMGPLLGLLQFLLL